MHTVFLLLGVVFLFYFYANVCPITFHTVSVRSYVWPRGPKTLTLSTLYRRSCPVLPCTFAKVFIFHSSWNDPNLTSFFFTLDSVSFFSPFKNPLNFIQLTKKEKVKSLQTNISTILPESLCFAQDPFLLWADEDSWSTAVGSLLRPL